MFHFPNIFCVQLTSFRLHLSPNKKIFFGRFLLFSILLYFTFDLPHFSLKCWYATVCYKTLPCDWHSYMLMWSSCRLWTPTKCIYVHPMPKHSVALFLFFFFIDGNFIASAFLCLHNLLFVTFIWVFSKWTQDVLPGEAHNRSSFDGCRSCGRSQLRASAGFPLVDIDFVDVRMHPSAAAWRGVSPLQSTAPMPAPNARRIRTHSLWSFVPPGRAASFVGRLRVHSHLGISQDVAVHSEVASFCRRMKQRVCLEVDRFNVSSYIEQDLDAFRVPIPRCQR